jgi:hypothetical protein
LQWLKDIISVLESVGGVDEVALDVSTISFPSLSHVESVHQQCKNNLSLSNESTFSSYEISSSAMETTLHAFYLLKLFCCK